MMQIVSPSCGIMIHHLYYNGDDKYVPVQIVSRGSGASSGSKDKRPEVTNGGAGSSSQGTSRRSQGKLVFGGSNVNRAKETQKEAAKETKLEQPQQKEEPKFQPFSGNKYSLKG
ncbi:uncharacterized protein LOC132276622 isoform X1 [Cornus florida]|uniref:uncharacterized protein LOC132276622 isoform X1 n=1 Tax=Cornus florida TaxID=4283 RepID=UPI002896C7E6|nr:uncharacterized protein LOC132276622 isoform X1 [Cornus florida]